jgi:hypothetical protein
MNSMTPPSPWVLLLTQFAILLPMLSVGAVIALTAHSWSRGRSARAVAAPLLGAAAGLLIGYFAGAYAACTWWTPESNLCGLPAVFVSAPIMAVAGAWIGWRTARRRI